MELSNDELKEFRDRALLAALYGHKIGLAELYAEALLAELGRESVSTEEPTAEQLKDLANEVLELRAKASKPKKFKAEKVEEPPPPEPKKEELPPPPPVEPPPVEKVEQKVEEPAPKTDEVPPPADKVDDKTADVPPPPEPPADQKPVESEEKTADKSKKKKH